jgi:ribosome biogenesis GTPase
LADAVPPINSLEALGFSEFFQRQLEALAGADGRPGRVVAQHRGEWDVLTEVGPVRAILAGRLYEAQHAEGGTLGQPTVGDWVLVSAPAAGHLHVIEHTFTRKSHLERGAAGRRREPQTIVANVDLVVVVCQLPPPGVQDAVAKRSINPRRIERYLSAVDQGGAQGVIALNKADLSPDAERIAQELRDRFAPCPVVTTSATHPHGLDALHALLEPGTTVGLVGLSGVGKSSVVNALLHREVQRTGAEREQDARGRHTTTHRELFITAEGVLVVDTPGMREFALSADEDDVGGFDDIAALAEGCRFRDCGHKSEPGCAVALAVASGQLSGERLASYHQLASELKAQRALRERSRRGNPHQAPPRQRPGQTKSARPKRSSRRP